MSKTIDVPSFLLGRGAGGGGGGTSDYNELENKPTINGVTLQGTLTTPDILSAFIGTDGVTDGTIGLVPAPTASDVDKFLKSDGTWDTAGGGTTITYGTQDLTPGVSELAEGTMYFMYE